jgi:excisionase family DNA binding protein
MRDMIAQPSAPQTVEIHQASPGFATPLEAAKLLRLSRAMGHELIGESKMPAYRYGRAVRIPLDVAYPDWQPSMKPVLEPETPFVEGMHVRAVCDHLQAVAEGRIRNLIVNIPPGHAKSLLTAVFWVAWRWIDHPEARWLFSSYREPLATRDSVKCRRLIESPWYQERWGDRYQLSDDQNQKSRFENTRTGNRVVVPMSAGTGERGDYVVVDDPHSVDQAESDTERRSAIEWWNGSMSTRLNDFATGHRIVIVQRLHEADLTGDLLAKGGWDLLCLPEEFEPERRCITSIGWTDPRQQSGELLWPDKVSPLLLAAERARSDEHEKCSRMKKEQRTKWAA